MNIEKQFQVLGLLRDDGIRTFRAKEIASGRDLQVHIFHSDAPGNRALFEQLRALPLSTRHELLELGFEDKAPYIVTDPLPRETDARAWFGRLLRPVETAADDASKFTKVGVWKTGVELRRPEPSGAGPEPGEFTRMFQGTPHAQPDPAPAEPGEFTRMFQPPAASAHSTAAPTPRSDEHTRPLQTHPAAPQPIPAEPGEFTRMFQSPAAPAHETASPGPSSLTSQPRAGDSEEVTRLFPAQPAAEIGSHVAGPPPQAAAAEVGEFTRMFQPHESAPVPAAPAAPPLGPGEFTRFFQSPMQPEPLSDGLRPPDSFRAPSGSPPPPHRAGEFTQMFGNPAQQVPPATLLGSSSSGPSATRAFAIPAAAPAPSVVSHNPGQYTRMMAVGAPPTLGQSVPQPLVAATKPANPMLPLLIVGGVILLFAILIVVFFAMRHR